VNQAFKTWLGFSDVSRELTFGLQHGKHKRIMEFQGGSCVHGLGALGLRDP
jgi:hypothetical protein